jgi:hypothetical protein
MYCVSPAAREMMPLFAFSRKAPSWANAVRHGSVEARFVLEVSASFGSGDDSVGW